MVTSNTLDLVAELGAEPVDDATRERLGEPNYNVAPMSQIPIVLDRDTEAGAVREAYRGQWGLVPVWAKDMKIGSWAFNARVETIESKPMFRSAFRRRRAIVPASGYYEWQKHADKSKTPYYLHTGDEELFLAGLNEWWRPKADPDGEWMLSATVVTTAANEKMASIHDRMPVGLPADYVDEWLGGESDDADAVKALLMDGAEEVSTRIEFREVSSQVGNVRNNGCELVEPVADE